MTITIFQLAVGGVSVVSLGVILAARSTRLWGSNALKSKPMTRYQEICAIKDRLYRDLVRLEELQGRATASDNVQRILLDTGLWKATR